MTSDSNLDRQWAGDSKIGRAADDGYFEIYGLFDPRTGELRYIGKARDSWKRYTGHLRDCERRLSPVYSWIRELAEARQLPEMRVLETGIGCWQLAEKTHIFHARLTGVKLLNLAAGGNAPHPNAAQNRLNALAAVKARPRFVMRAYRAMECGIRFMKRRFPEETDRIERHQRTLERLRAAVAHHRVSGSLAAVDRKLEQYFISGIVCNPSKLQN